MGNLQEACALLGTDSLELDGAIAQAILLPKRRVLCLGGEAPLRMSCESGCLWLTHLNEPCDIVLTEGQSSKIRPGAVIQALQPSLLVLAQWEAAPAAGWPIAFPMRSWNTNRPNAPATRGRARLK